ncbi:MAG: hypothetical protein FWF57_02300 [Defluviitaleaceae bacterium]|nr:hypothetical protein [Defluviitaleaceae bacterium]
MTHEVNFNLYDNHVQVKSNNKKYKISRKFFELVRNELYKNVYGEYSLKLVEKNILPQEIDNLIFNEIKEDSIKTAIIELTSNLNIMCNIVIIFILISLF